MPLSPEQEKLFITIRFEEHRQLLRGAIQAMAAGDITRALNVATEIRVLVHETGNQKPLLKHMKPAYLDLSMLECVEKAPPPTAPGVQAITFFCPISASFSEKDGKVVVSLMTDLAASEYVQSTLGHWWEGICMVLPGIGPVRRRDLILNVDDKEAAHVDPKIGEGFQKLLGSGFFRFNMNGDDAPINISRMVVGKCGVELLDCLDKNFPEKAVLTPK